ncbi:MAG: hypothetical protein JXD19_05035, partial [Deltaproteobacteria bacterium]|nr:hypothetical protein [Deltaproteobacteria bacterium]
AHYEAILFGGDTRRKGYSLARCFPALVGRCISLMPSLEDDRRLMDLTTTLDRDQGSLLYHRLDRLSLTLQPHWGVIRIGRQAVTWGNGLIFNPMDLFNPFSPTDIERDYKIGDDLVSVQVPLRRKGDLQLLYVPRRSVETHRVQWDHSSLAAKLHFSRGMTEFDVMASKHYEDAVVGIEGAGYFKQAAWRLDAILTIMDRHSDSEGYIVLVANIDYSWMWKEKNWYGFLEVYFNGLSHDRYTDGLTNPDIFERLARGELFTLGRIYLSAHVMSELHPLFSAYLTVISNLADPSAVLQPHAIWDIIENVQVTVGGNISLGEQGTEFGGFTIPGSRLLLKPTDSAFVWVSYYF